MLDAIRTGPLPLLYPCAAPGLVDAVHRAAGQTSEARTFDREHVGRLRATRRQRHDFRLPSGAGHIYLEIWADDVLCRPHALGVLFDRRYGEFVAVVGKGWPGDDPELLPARFVGRAGGLVTLQTYDAVKPDVRRAASGWLDILRALDAVAREEGATA
ncbi:hypothetical protein [Nguyenibacter sp. L1]|uniref:hypothetical protein n=1 Tax=Nguyenibacter sp. L1 TaxID=3049350 RepID=UPI002B46C467|nr:hypothetical protein [Nguyenibacter sp. L1]WRH89568.1 hypothetical protein QN315_08260 [Nguyenibacter sp. L1]